MCPNLGPKFSTYFLAVLVEVVTEESHQCWSAERLYQIWRSFKWVPIKVWLVYSWPDPMMPHGARR